MICYTSFLNLFRTALVEIGIKPEEVRLYSTHSMRTGGATAAAGSMTALDLDGATMTLDINQIGDSNKFLGDITADTFTGFFEFDGDSNTFNIQTDPTNTYGADSGNFNVDVTGSSNTFTLDVATNDLAGTLDLDWIIQGDSNTFDFDIDYDTATNYVDVDGDSNTINFDGDGYADAFFKLASTARATRLFKYHRGYRSAP